MKKTFVITVVVLCVVIGLVFIFLLRGIGGPVEAVFGEEDQIGEAGPIRLNFAQSMDKTSVEERVRIEPRVETRFNWVENSLLVLPEISFDVGQYKLVLEVGSSTTKGEFIGKTVAWTFSVREQEIIFLYPADGASDLWKSDLAGNLIKQLTKTNGKVYDYSVSKDGEMIVFSAINSENGKDLWLVDREGNDPGKLLACGSDYCFEPAISPDGSRMAYSRVINREGVSERGSNIWLMDVTHRKPSLLVDDPSINGSRSVWSPTGDRLVFLDEMQGFIRVFDLNKREITNLQSTGMEIGAWSPDGKKMLIPSEYLVGVQSFSGLSLVDFEEEIIEPLFAQNQNMVDLFTPKYSPRGDQIIVGRREQLINGRSSIQIWLIDLRSKKMEPITTDQNYSHGGFHWSPRGEQVVFQRYPLGSSNATPEIFIWDQVTGTSQLIIENAAIPKWLP